MDAVIDLGARLGGVDLTGIVLNIVFLTIPGLALAKGLKRFRTPREIDQFSAIEDGGRAGQVKARVQRAGGQLASFVTIVAVLTAGLGLVPLTRAGYEMLAGLNEAAPAVIGVIVMAVLLVKGFVMAHDLMDGTIDRPHLWLAPVPLLAMLIWVAPVVTDQITDQAGQTVQLIVDEAKADGQARENERPSRDKPRTGKPRTGKPRTGKPRKDDPGERGR
jgi:hypothetical protein